uniref:NnrS protein involved in response to NO n=1 Tax=uncultured Thiotrichaceae bacterium TaxID=298394 RepID=A0A6S6UBF2_9GAMM|nr:MAG: NnrS protein involved in response to NO [uncultured Thiotrichaceae bacterium]
MLMFEPTHKGRYAFLQLGFRPFFLAAMAGATLLGIIWSVIYSFNGQLLRSDYPIISWHAHEMIFAYSLAVVSGFLLTAVKNRTGIQTINGKPLLVLALLWLVGRALPFIPELPFWFLALHESSFLGLVVFFAAQPIIQTRQWKQMAILGKLFLFIPASILFHLGLSGVLASGKELGIYLALYTLIALILTMGRRVIPSFIENAVGGGFQAKNDIWLDRLSLGMFLVFLIAELYALVTGHSTAVFIGGLIALTLFVLHAFRLFGWHHRQLWQHSLLWSLYLAYAWITIGFLLKFLVVAINYNPWAAVHAFGYGGIGLITAGMMARVILGHTGRNVFAPPAILPLAFGLLTVGTFLRAVMTWLLPEYYQIWILAAQIIWVVAFASLLAVYAPMLIKARVEGRPG